RTRPHPRLGQRRRNHRRQPARPLPPPPPPQTRQPRLASTPHHQRHHHLDQPHRTHLPRPTHHLPHHQHHRHRPGPTARLTSEHVVGTRVGSSNRRLRQSARFMRGAVVNVKPSRS